MDDNPYELLALDADDHRWAFGAAFTDPLDGVDTSVPSGIDAAALGAYCLMLGDDALVLSHRLQQWVTRLPELEEETAVANIALDLLGQARLLLARAGSILGRTEDELAFFRTEGEFRNVRLVEPADADFAELVGRLLVFSSWRLALAEGLRASADPVLAGIGAKSVPELTYHRDYAGMWVVRLGDGTAESARRMQSAVDRIWPYVEELFAPHPVEQALPGVAAVVDRAQVDGVLDTVLATAALARPATAALATVGGRAGRDGVHTEGLGFVLAELQSVARADPDARW
jgi:ring-1,2-phenylacetyl-CoA epoxidase subunit PaaC